MRDHLLQNLDNISAVFSSIMKMAEHTHFLKDVNRFETMILHSSPIPKQIVGKTIEAIREINGTLNIDYKRHNMIFKSILEKWAKILTPAYSFQEKQDCLLDICNHIVEDYSEFPIIITNAISITSSIIGFIQNRLKEE
jgi:hypothetical protein